MASVSSWFTTAVAPAAPPQRACSPSKSGILRSCRSSLWLQSRSPDLKLLRHSSDFSPVWRGGLAQRAKLRAVGQVEMEQRVDMIPLTELPYPLDALEPHISRKTLEVHWDKIHRAYVENLNEQIRDTDLERHSLEEILKISYNNGNPSPVFNSAAQAWNLEFYWLSMQPGGGGIPSGEVMELIERDFGSFEDFVFEFKQAACTHFGSGWTWLVLKDTKLVIEKTPNAINPLIWGHTPLLVIDLWEHAYFLDYQNRRAEYVSTFVEELISWVAVEGRLIRAKAFVNLGEPNIPEE